MRWGAGLSRLTFVALLAAVIPAGPTSASDGFEMAWQVSAAGRGVPAADRDAVYVLTRGNEVLALDRRTGTERWRSPVETAAAGATASRLLVARGVVIAGGHAVAGLDAGSGREIWRTESRVGYGAGYYLGAAVGGSFYAGSADGVLQGFDIATGQRQVLWRLGGPGTVVHAPAVDGTDLVSAFTDPAGDVRGLAMFDLGTRRLRWTRRLVGARATERPPAVAGGPVFTPDLVVVSGHDGSIHAFERRSGATVWSLAPDGSDPDFRPLAVRAGLLVAGSLTGEVVAYDLASRAERWRRRAVLASVAFALTASPSSLFVPYLSGELVALAWDDGRERWRVGGHGEGFRWPPHVDGFGVIMAGSGGGILTGRDRWTND